MPNPVLTRAIDRLAAREDLTTEDTAAVLAEIMGGNASEVETAAVLIALRTLWTGSGLPLGTGVAHVFTSPQLHGNRRRAVRLATGVAAALLDPPRAA